MRPGHVPPTPQAVLDVLRRCGVPLPLARLAAELDVGGERAVGALLRRLKDMVASGQLVRNRRAEYCLLERIDALVGTISAHRDGFGFLIADDGTPDVYIPASEMRALLDGDRVVVHVSEHGRQGRRAGSVVEILARARQRTVGCYQREHGIGYVTEAGRSPRQYLVPDHHRGGAQPGQLVCMEITVYPDVRHEAQGRVERILGDIADKGVITDAAIALYNIPDDWPAAVMGAADACRGRRDVNGDARRTDLRELPLVTIDGEDARDYDDAVWAAPSGDGWRLVVAIADVSFYVRRDDPLDVEARRRGTSVYFPDRVVPMLPEALSNDLCSLRPDVDRSCLVCDMTVGPNGAVKASRFYRATIRSHARLTYTQVAAARELPAARAELGGLWPGIESLYGVYGALSRARSRRGALDLDLPEVRICVGDDGQVCGVEARQRTDAHLLVEECMIAANVEAGRFLRRHRLPALYRVHAGPEGEKLENLRALFQALGVPLDASAQRTPREINRALSRVKDRADFPMLATAVLRSLKQAVYQPENVGHFGLSLACYTHFTSPIRRYPDLLVHRVIGHLLDGGKPGDSGYGTGDMELLGKASSVLERRAEECCRHVEARLKCLYMADRVGEVMSGTVTGVAHFGLFVTLQEVFVDGLIHVTGLGNDYFHVSPGGLGLHGERSGETFDLGQELAVRIMRVDVDEGRVDLALADRDGSRPRPSANRPPRGRRRR